jgi:hypothetical protein
MKSMQPTAPADAPQPAPATSPDERLAYLFRHSQRRGRVHPLQHLIQRLRAGEKT